MISTTSGQMAAFVILKEVAFSDIVEIELKVFEA